MTNAIQGRIDGFWLVFQRYSHGVTQQELEATDHMNSQEAESKECLCSAHFLNTQSRTKEWYGLLLEWVFPP